MRNLARKTALVALTLFSLKAHAAFEELQIGVSSQAMGGTGVVATGLGSVMWNPAGISGGEYGEVGLESRLPFSKLDFATHGLDVSHPLGGSVMGAASLRYFGSDLYSEQVLALTAAALLSKDMSVGIQPLICRAQIADGVGSYGSATTVAWNLGFQVRMYSRWMLAASVRNPFQARLGESSDYLQRRMDAGLSYEPQTGLCSRVTVSRDFGGTRVHVGQSLPLGPLSLMAGVQSNPTTATGGLGVTVSGIRFEYAVQSHPELDLTHQAGVTYGF
ncbi:hypothetical protein GF402_00760 [Candidatus Fermentibacteria bacterium]|nr:hypothetical protein [Candidatus Fermentibacteria bacterium]